MKNFIPLILAVVLGLAVVFGINHILAEKERGETAMVSVVAAAQKIPVGGVITASVLVKKDIPRNAMPAKAVPWAQRQLLLKQKSLKVITSGDYILWSDLGGSSGISSLIGEGEWAISVPFSDSAIAPILRPGDEIAIIGTFTEKTKNENIVVGANSPAAKEAAKRVTLTVLPRVRIVSISGEGGSVVVVALKPEQAQLLIDAQRVASLYPALRRPNDDTNTNRLKTGKVAPSTYENLVTGQQVIELPAVPDAN